ncbi:hypothetical protein Hanom_Chr01g00046881 [Helianthus anomalus]
MVTIKKFTFQKKKKKKYSTISQHIKPSSPAPRVQIGDHNKSRQFGGSLWSSETPKPPC